MSTALLTDRYELTMLDAALQSGRANRRCIFEVFSRHLPEGRRFGVVAGTGRVLDLIEQFHFGESELEYLERFLSPRTLDWLANYRFTGTVFGYHEGELYFPGSPVLVVEGTFAEAVILETLILSILNFDSAVASAAARMVIAAEGRPIVEMGSRRTGERSAIAAARAAYIAGFTATSNLEAGRRWGIPTMGTAAHAFTLLHDNEREAFAAQIAAFGPSTTLLVDTFDIPTAVALAIEVAGPELGAVRIDSGNLPVVVRAVRAQLDQLGATKTTITVTNELDEFAIAGLQGAPVGAYGVGTSVVTGSGHPAAGFVYKLVAHANDAGEWIPVAKRSAEKATVGGQKYASRSLRGGVAIAETIHIGSPGADGRDLLVPLIRNGIAEPQAHGTAGVTAARAHHAFAMAELPSEALRIARGDPAIPTVYA